jgi:hypothetical protein
MLLAEAALEEQQVGLLAEPLAARAFLEEYRLEQQALLS